MEPRIVVFPGVAGAAPKLDPNALAALLAGRLRPLQLVCGAMLGTAALMAAASAVVVWSLAVAPVASTQVSLTLTFAAIVLILAASRLHAAILMRAGRGAPASNPAAAAAAASAVIDGYARATTISFVLLDATASLGLVVAVVTGSVRYSLVICAAAALGMLARWPRRASIAGLLRRRGLA